jgi:hypothetical protein
MGLPAAVRKLGLTTPASAADAAGHGVSLRAAIRVWARVWHC